ncbi:hypothetical protein LAZ40_06690 [Cereibacter sphaeroides]|uniref:hypothetical protein n=1 Tax=Cereibacter sphaeroides TaxID=1063 RepID=UPI001F41754C|nr:hypothetical protein [Cereibacter sphaeroides]MCE6958733.1 hypothetical protein [Cereibacter sphaeroides]MCE6973393.1 hypothetical protein [Cereibacter sphaeroides]
MFDLRREGPASSIEIDRFDFTNFHDGTHAAFAPAVAPDREPDFISAGRSVYWDTGTGVIRASDHWSGHHGRTMIASCFWTYEGPCRAGEWETGFAPYAGFRRRVREVPLRVAEAEDVLLARLIHEGGGGIDPADWRRLVPGAGVPAWARVAPRGTLAAAPAEAVLAARPDLARILTAEASTVARILRDGEVAGPARLA